MPTSAIDLRQLQYMVLQFAGFEEISANACEDLAHTISQKTKRQLSETTLKRLYGFAAVQFRLSRYTLDTLALFCGYKGWSGWQRHLRQSAVSSTECNTESRDFNKLFYYSTQAMWIFSMKTLQFLEVNTAACKLYGYSREQFLSMTVLDIRPPEDKVMSLEAIGKPGSYHFHNQIFRHLLANGELIVVDIITYEFDWQGEKARLVVPLRSSSFSS